MLQSSLPTSWPSSGFTPIVPHSFYFGAPRGGCSAPGMVSLEQRGSIPCLDLLVLLLQPRDCPSLTLGITRTGTAGAELTCPKATPGLSAQQLLWEQWGQALAGVNPPWGQTPGTHEAEQCVRGMCSRRNMVTWKHQVSSSFEVQGCAWVRVKLR